MTGPPDNHDLARRLAVLEERMKTMDERYDRGWALLREDMAKRDMDSIPGPCLGRVMKCADSMPDSR